MDIYANAKLGIKYVFYQRDYHLQNKKKENERHLANYYKNKEAEILWRQNNPGEWKLEQKRKKEYNDQYRKENYNKVQKKEKEYYVQNREKRNEHSRAWHWENREWYNPIHNEKCKKTYKLQMETDENYRIKVLLRSQLGLACIHYGRGKKMPASKYGIDYDAIIKYLGPKPRPEYSIDHIKPLSLFDFTDPKQVKEAFAPENHRWLPLKENVGRGGMNRPQIREQFGITNYSRPLTLRINNHIIPNEEIWQDKKLENLK